MKTWKELSTQQKIDEIISAHKGSERISALDISTRISENFTGVTRNSIIGLYDRHKAKLVQFPLNGADGPKPARPDKPRRGIRSTKVRKTLPPAPKPVALPEPVPFGKELWELEAGECKWPVSGDGDKTLFCACGADLGKPYCAHHTERGLSKSTRTERSQPKPQALRTSSLMRRITGSI